MCICVKIWLNCFSYYYHHATTIMVNKDYYKSKQLIPIPDDTNSHRRSHDSAVETRRPASADRTARRHFQATGQPVSRIQARDAMTSRLPRYEAKCVQRRFFQWGRSLCIQISSERSYPLPIYWYHSKDNWLRYNFAADSFYIMKLFSRLFVLYCRNCAKDDKFR